MASNNITNNIATIQGHLLMLPLDCVVPVAYESSYMATTNWNKVKDTDSRNLPAVLFFSNPIIANRTVVVKMVSILPLLYDIGGGRRCG